ncbi:MAG: hypothetical protein JO165_01845, partial [Candidatus Eremiobacteraeota bacterium]|nr:hypothetical protein [Candidatus Eremiobacteraeota bacterium]
MIESRILLALFNGAWQSGIVCLVAFLALRRTRKLNATNVHGIWNVLLCISVALPFANFAFTKPAHTVMPKAAAAHVHFAVSSTHSHVRYVPPVGHYPMAAVTTMSSPTHIDASEMWFNAELYALRHARPVLLLMALLAFGKLAFLLRDLAVMFRLRRRVRPVSLEFNLGSQSRREFAVAATDELRSPCVLGFAKPLVVVPGALLDVEHEERLRDILLHEVAHIARWDDVQNFLH